MEEAAIEKLRKLHNAKNEEELLAAIGSKAIVLGEADKNELKEKQTSNWKKYLTFSFGNSKEKQEEKEPQEKEKNQPERGAQTDGRKFAEEIYHGRMLPSYSR